MELMTLNDAYQPVKMIENYASLIWTERYAQSGDFELVTNDVERMLGVLPLETAVTLRETSVPMIVEQHKITKDPNNAPVLTIKGRSFETVLERRGSVQTPSLAVAATTPRVAWMMDAATESDAAYKAMRVVLGDIDRYKMSQVVLPSIAPAVSPLDAIPEIDLVMPLDYSHPSEWNSTQSYSAGEIVRLNDGIWRAVLANTNVTPATGATWQRMQFEIPPGDLYSTVMELLGTHRRGLKAVRPGPNDAQVKLEIYNGANLTETVVFDARFDQFDSATYLLSKQGMANVGYVYGINGQQVVNRNAIPETWVSTKPYPTGSVVVFSNETYRALIDVPANATPPGGMSSTFWLPIPSVEPSGLDRRVLVVDQTSDNTTNSAEIRRQRGLIELYKRNPTALFDGEVSVQVASGYNRDYFLGDILKLTGEYGLSQNVRVAEFIRTDDNTGEKAYPAFEAIDE